MLARQRRWFLVRSVLIALILAVMLMMVHAMWKSMQFGTPMAFVAPRIFRTFMFVALFFVCLPAPAFGVGALEDAQKPGSLDLLRLASIPRPLLGWIKLLGASVWPILLSASLIPFLSLWSLWGGVELELLVAAICLITCSSICLAGFGLVAGAATRSPISALGVAYGLTLTYFVAVPLAIYPLSPGLLMNIHAPWMLWQIAYGTGLGGFGGVAQIHWVIPCAVSCGIAALCALLTGLALILRDYRVSGRTRARTKNPPVTVRHALLWREMRTGQIRRTRWLVRIAWAASLVLVIGAELFRQGGSGLNAGFFAAIITAYPVLPAFMIAIIAGSIVSSDREAGTLTPVLLTPRSASSILGAKIMVVIAKVGPLFIAPAIYGLTVIRHEFRLRSEDMLLLASFGGVCLQIGGFGLLCSVLFRRSSMAVGATVIGALAQIFITGYLSIRLLDALHLGNDIEIMLWAAEGPIFAVGWVILAAIFFERSATRV